MARWIKKIHIYLGLLNFSILLIYGVAGLVATFGPRPRPRPEPVAELKSYTAPTNLTDHEVAGDVQRFLGASLANPVPKYAVRRDKENRLTFELYSANGPTAVTVLEAEHQIRVETRRNHFLYFLSNLHATTLSTRAPDLRIRLWAWYNELAIWSLLAMSITGLYLWLSSRPRFGWAQLSFLAGSGIFVALYALTR